MSIAAQNDLCVCRDGAFQNAVVRRIGLDGVDSFRRRDHSAEDAELLVALSEFFGRAVELVSKDAKGFIKDRFGKRELDVTFSGQLKELLRFSSELNGAYKDIRICDDPLHERLRDSWTARSTTPSTSSSVMFPRRSCPSRPTRSS